MNENETEAIFLFSLNGNNITHIFDGKMNAVGVNFSLWGLAEIGSAVMYINQENVHTRLGPLLNVSDHRRKCRELFLIREALCVSRWLFFVWPLDFGSLFS